MSTKSYIGDGVYAEISDYGELVLTTENGLSVTNRIVLEAREWAALKRFVEPPKPVALEDTPPAGNVWALPFGVEEGS